MERKWACTIFPAQSSDWDDEECDADATLFLVPVFYVRVDKQGCRGHGYRPTTVVPILRVGYDGERGGGGVPGFVELAVCRSYGLVVSFCVWCLERWLCLERVARWVCIKGME
jgi:hypothetical protein